MARHIERLKTDEIYYFKRVIRNIVIRSVFKCETPEFYIKLAETILGCTIKEFKLQLESNFELWMNWDNRGKYNGEFNHGWDIDHIIPLGIATSKEDVIKLWHHSNLNPLCSKINRYIKKDRVDFHL
jgi:hypothetical protein